MLATARGPGRVSRLSNLTQPAYGNLQDLTVYHAKLYRTLFREGGVKQPKNRGTR